MSVLRRLRVSDDEVGLLPSRADGPKIRLHLASGLTRISESDRIGKARGHVQGPAAAA